MTGKLPVKTRRADPKHGELGVLVDQYVHVIYPNLFALTEPWSGKLIGSLDEPLGGYRLFEIVEVYLSQMSWEDIPGQSMNVNNTSNKKIIKMTESHTTTVSNSTEESTRIGFSLKVKDVGFDISNEKTTFESYETQSLQAETITLTSDPGQTLYCYQLVHHFNVRVWWVAEFDGLKRVVTPSDSYSTTYEGKLKATANNGSLASVAPLTGLEYFDMEPLKKSIGDSTHESEYPRSKFNEVPIYLQGWIDQAWARASGNPPSVNVPIEVGKVPPDAAQLPPLWSRL